jgi:hypothetical protein
MASEILGLFTSPEMYQRQQDLMMQRQAAELAQLDPYQNIRFSAIRAGQQFGQGLAGLLGAEDPQLRMISARQSVLGGLDLSNPDAIFSAARQLSGMRDPQGALALAEYGRKVQGDKALAEQRTRERTSPALLAAARIRELESGKQKLIAEGASADSPELKLIDTEISDLRRGGRADDVPKFGEKVEGKSFELFDKPYSQLTTAERKSVNDAIRVEGEKADKAPSYGTDREAAAQELYGENFGKLTQTQKAAVNKLVEDREGKKASASAAKLVLPGQSKEGAKDVPAFRDKVINTIDPFRKTVTAADSAITNISDSIKTSNFASFRAAQTQFARAISGAGDLSQKELKAAGADPSLLGGTADYLSTVFTSTPTKDTQQKLLSTLKAIRTVAAKKAKDEIANQKKIATRAGFTQDDTDLIFNFPEFEQRAGGGKTTTRTLKSGKTVTITED